MSENKLARLLVYPELVDKYHLSQLEMRALEDSRSLRADAAGRFSRLNQGNEPYLETPYESRQKLRRSSF